MPKVPKPGGGFKLICDQCKTREVSALKHTLTKSKSRGKILCSFCSAKNALDRKKNK